MSREDDRIIANGVRAVRSGAAALIVERCVKAAAARAGCDWEEVMGKRRGEPKVARARVVAMLACVALGVPVATTARAFRRSRRAVQSALKMGRPGRESRDAEVMRDLEEVARGV